MWPCVCLFAVTEDEVAAIDLWAELIFKHVSTFTLPAGTLNNVKVLFCLMLPDTRENIALLSVSGLALLF
jgi:hypothetical protein